MQHASTHSSHPPLQALLSEKWVLSWRQAVSLVIIASSFLLLNYLPMAAGPIWSQIAAGEWMLTQGIMPVWDVHQPLSKGMPFHNTHWLSDLIWGGIHLWGGAKAVSCFYAGIAFAIGVSWLALFQRAGRCGLASMLAWSGCMIALVILSTPGAAVLGVLCMSILLWVTAGPRTSRLHWLAVAVIICLWANIHTTFLFGIIWLALGLVGRLVEICVRTGRPAAAISNRQFQRWVWFCQVGILAACVNPQGWNLLTEAVRMQWDAVQPIVLWSLGGALIALASAALVVVWRLDRTRLSASEWLPVVGLGVLAASRPSWIIWFLPVASLIAVQRVGRLVSRTSKEAEPARALNSWDFRYSLLALLGVWIAFSLAPASQPLLGGNPRSNALLFGNRTPLTVVQHLRTAQPAGMIWAPNSWSDFLVAQQDTNWELFSTSNIQALPRLTQRDYLRIARAEKNWPGTLDRYAIRVLVVDKQRQPDLAEQARSLEGWQVSLDDQQALVLQR